jgi:hypothetical protein
MKKRIKLLTFFCLGLVVAVGFISCNLDADMGIFEAIGNSEPTLDTTNQSILGFYGNQVYIKAQDGIYKYGASNSAVEKLPLSLMTNGFATSIGNATAATEFIYQDGSGDFKKYTITTGASESFSLSDVRAMNNGVVLSESSPANYTVLSLPNTQLASLSAKGSAGIMFGFVDNVLTTMIKSHKNANKVTVYDFAYYWNDTKLNIVDNAAGDLAKLVNLNLTDDQYKQTTKTNFIRIQAFQPATAAGPGVAIAKIANDSYTSLIFIQEAVGGELKYIGQSGFYLNYYSSYAVPSARVEIAGKQYMLVPYSSGLRLIDLTSSATIKTSAIDSPSSYAYASSNTNSFARGLTYNNIVDIKPIPGQDATAAKNKYLVSTVNSGVYTITLPTAAGDPSNNAGSRAIGYQPIV